MDIRIDERVELPLSPEQTYDFLVSPNAYKLFTGWGPIPGIREVVWEKGSSTEEGSVGTVHSTDGSTHTETIVEAVRPTRYAARIDGFNSAFRFLTSGARETWDMSATSNGTLVERCFVFTLRSPVLWPVGALLGRFFRAAVRRNHEGMQRWAREQPAPADSGEAMVESSVTTS